ncbi:hypothetical protein ZHAS_00021676 [Anopheles sinensis]|uniref:Uncharacterized protein n=1 Tax=Anopheles sinensis TaxID=74873 RepID=A0A084WT21_ANOSI|nr:hypothetical protein ZHAS_00021676 [Anopheles sinensis]
MGGGRESVGAARCAPARGKPEPEEPPSRAPGREEEGTHRRRPDPQTKRNPIQTGENIPND